ncbi:hypothetical protein [Dyella jiangningensis]|uniref:hypothetical protein n=1 Tax=Dyella jiangningensis TaxID=1379159 RepID=UPI0011BE4C11|nr:hypothetical protein [Dyella jiangningensis]
MSRLDRRHCLGCEKRIRNHHAAMTVTHTSGSLVTEYTICAPCVARTLRDEGFASELNARAEKMPARVAA